MNKRFYNHGYLLYDMADDGSYILVGVVDSAGHCIDEELGITTDEQEAIEFVTTGNALTKVSIISPDLPLSLSATIP